MTASPDHWNLKEHRPKGFSERWFFRKNLVPVVGAPNSDYGFIAFLTFSYLPRDESGLPSLEDEATVFHIEDTKIGDLEADGLATHVAAVIKGGIKDLLFCTRDAREFLVRAEKFRHEYPQFQVTCKVSPDPDWSQYKDFP